MGAMEDEIVLSRSFGVATYPAGASFGPRRLRDWEFVWIIHGDASYRRGNISVAAPQDSIVLCRPGATDAFTWDATRRTRHAFFHFQLKHYPQNWAAQNSWPLVRAPLPDDVSIPLFQFLLAWLERDDETSKAQCQNAAALLLSSFVTGQSSTSPVPHEALPDTVERALEYLRARLEADAAAPIVLKDLARAAFVSPEHLCRVFKESSGRSPLETVRLARLDRAASLLARTNYSIAEISKLCGFASPFHFSRKFKEAYGQSPRELRADVRAGSTPPTPRLLRVR